MNSQNHPEIEARLLELIRDEFPVAKSLDLRPDQNMLEVGAIDSLGLLKIIELVQSEFDIQVGDFDVVMENFGTVSTLARYVLSKTLPAA